MQKSNVSAVRYSLRSLLIAVAAVPPALAVLWCGVPAAWILAAATASSFIAASVGTLLFFWRFDLRTVLGATAGSIVGVYFFIFAQCLIDGRSLLVFQPWPVSAQDGLALAFGVCVTGIIGSALGFLFAGVIRVVYFFSGSFAEGHGSTPLPPGVKDQ